MPFTDPQAPRTCLIYRFPTCEPVVLSTSVSQVRGDGFGAALLKSSASTLSRYLGYPGNHA